MLQVGSAVVRTTSTISGMPLIGDGDRERAAELLRRHYLRGRLSLDELTERLDVALSARRDHELRPAFTGLPSMWRDGVTGSRLGLDGAWRAVRRTAFVVALWLLWWTASIVLLIGLVASLVMSGFSWTTPAVFVALWLAVTFAIRYVTRRRSWR